MVQFFSPASIGSAALLTALSLASTAALAADPIEEKARICAACHGENGIPQLKTTPVIWGQNEGYLYLQLRDFKSGARKNELMSAIAATLEKKDMLALAAHFTKLKWPNLQQPEAPKDVAEKARRTSASVGCPGCHLTHYQGDGTTARLAGQQHDYLLKTIMDFRDKKRGNNPGMTDLMNAASPEELATLAEYLAGLQVDQYLESEHR
jgi:cytochrome c553